MNCAITIIQHDTKPTSPAPAPTATVVKPTAAPAATKPIKSTDDLIKEFSDQFTGIGRFPGEYTIWLHPDVHPIIHDPRKCPITLCPKVKEHLNKMECMEVITHVDWPMDWVSSITYIQKANGELCLCLDPHDLNKAICHDHHKTPTVEEVTHEFVHSCYFTKLDAHHGYWVDCSWSGIQPTHNLPQPLQKILVPACSLWSCLSSRQLPEEDGPDPRRVPRMYQNSRWYHCPWPHQSGTWCLPVRTSCVLPSNMG